MNRCFMSGAALVLLTACVVPAGDGVDLLGENVTLESPAVSEDSEAAWRANASRLALESPAARQNAEVVDLFAGKVSLGTATGFLKLPLETNLVTTRVTKAAQAAPEAPGEARLPAELRPKWRVFFGKCRTSRLELCSSEMAREERELAEKGKLGEAARKTLKELGTAAVEACLKSWENWFADRVLTILELSGEPAALLETLSAADTVYRLVPPEQSGPLTSAAWKEGIRTLVDARILTDLEKERASRRGRVMEEFGDRLTGWEDTTRDASRAVLQTQLEQFGQFAGISEEKKQALAKAAEEAVKQATAHWREWCTRMLLAASDEERRDFLDQNRPPPSVPSGLGQRAEYQEVWLQARKEHIGPGDLAKVEEGRSRVRSRREQALAMLTLAEMDKVIGFGPAQREALLGEACQQMKALPRQFYDRGDNNSYFSIDFQELLGRIKKIPAEVTKKILTESQARRWEALTADQLTDDRFNYRRTIEKSKEEPAPPDLDEAGAQRLIGLVLEREAGNCRKAAQHQMEARAEMVIASAQPRLPEADQIRTAAKGAAELKAQEAISQMEQHLLSQLRKVTPAEVPQRLKALSIPSGYSSQSDAEPALWTACLQRVLTKEQLTTWKNELKEQARWQRAGISAVLVTEITKTVVLSPEKSEALRTKMDDLMETYGDDITAVFSRRWYLQGYYGPIPLALLPEKELAEYFTAPQLDVLRSGALGRAMQYSQMIKQRHKQRTNSK